MAVYRVTAPVSKVNALVAGVRLVDSDGQLDGDQAPSSLAYFRRHGYTVELVEEPAPATPNRGSSKAEWVAYITGPHAPDGKQLTETDANDRTRDQLAEHVLGSKED